MRHRIAEARFEKHNPGFKVSIDIDFSIKKISKVADDTKDASKLRELEKILIEKYGADPDDY